MLGFDAGSTHIVFGQSGSGKTNFIMRILQNKQHLFGAQPPSIVKYYYGIWQDTYNQMQESIENISFQKGLPTEDELLTLTDPENHSLIIVDDLMNEAANSSVMELLFTRISHHRNCTCFYILQNAFISGKKQVTINLNAKYIEVFRSPRSLLQLSYLNSQIFPQNPGFLIRVYDDVMKNEQYGYLVIDLTAQCPDELRLRTKIFPGEDTIIYKTD